MSVNQPTTKGKTESLSPNPQRRKRSTFQPISHHHSTMVNAAKKLLKASKSLNIAELINSVNEFEAAYKEVMKQLSNLMKEE